MNKEVDLLLGKTDDWRVEMGWYDAIKQGFNNCNFKVNDLTFTNQIKNDNVAFWGWRIAKKFLNKNRIIFEHGFIGDRCKYISVFTNGLNGEGEFHNVVNDGGERFDDHFGQLYKPWNPDGDYILLVGQTPGDQTLKGLDLMLYYTRMAHIFKNKFNLPVIFRQHPNLTRKGINQNVIGTKKCTFESIDEAISGAKFVVCFNSNTAVCSLLAGKPTFVHNKVSVMYDIANNNINYLTLDEPTGRREYFNRLAWKQWTLEEITSGVPLQNVVK